MMVNDEATLRDALQRLIDAVWQRPSQAAFSIPADTRRDADCILSDAIDELLQLRAKLAVLENQLAAIMPLALAGVAINAYWQSDTRDFVPAGKVVRGLELAVRDLPATMRAALEQKLEDATESETRQ